MDAQIIAILRNLSLTPEQAEEQIRIYVRQKMNDRLRQMRQ